MLFYEFVKNIQIYITDVRYQITRTLTTYYGFVFLLI